MHDEARAFVARTWTVPRETVGLEVRPLHGGLESTVARARLIGSGPAGAPRRFVIKELRGGQRREAEIYRMLWQQVERPPAARVLGIEPATDADYLYLEDVRRISSWPWRDHTASAAVCRALARLHDTSGLLPPGGWDYEAELAESARQTMDAALTVRASDGTLLWQRVSDLKRLVDALPVVRDRLLGEESTVIHGDVHPGNVIVRPTGRGDRVALIDWARARMGSPLEDVASWLHSLGCWEWEARRRHDSLLRAYLENRRTPRALTPDVRQSYWLASACNGLSGAIRYHLVVLANAASSENAKWHSAHAVREWQRVIRGAAVVVRTGCG